MQTASSNNFHKQIINFLSQNIADAIVVTDLDYKITGWNKGAEKIYGYKQIEVLGRIAREIVQTEFLAGDGLVWQKIFNTIGNWQGEVIQKKKDGTSIHILASIAYLKDRSGKNIGTIAINRNITEERKKDHALKESEKRFRALADEAPVFIFIAGEDAEVEYLNKNWLNFTGMQFEEAKGKAWAKVTHPDDLELIFKTYSDAFKSRESYSFTIRQKGIDNIYKWIFWKGIPRYLANNQFIGMMGVGVDITSQKQAEEKLILVQKQLELTIENVPAAVYLYDNKGVILYVNKNGVNTIKSILGTEFNPTENLATLMKRGLENVTYEDEDGNPLSEEQYPMSIVLHTGKEAELLIKRIFKTTREVVWFLNRVTPLLNEEGNIQFILSTSTDFTKQKYSEEKIRESEKKFRQISDELPHMLWQVELDGTISYINKQWADYSGLTLEEINQGGWNKVFHPEDAVQVGKGWVEAFQNKHIYVGECRIKNPGGTYSWFTLKTVPIKNDEGDVMLWIGSATNIDEKKSLEIKINESAEQFRTLANSISQLAWIANADGWIYWYNMRWYDYTGTTLEEMEGWGWEKVHHPDHIERVVWDVKKLWHTDAPFEMTFPLKRHDGVYRWFLTRVYPLKNIEGKVIQWIGTNTDIDDYKKAMEQKDEFLKIASHELRTPVTSLKGFNQILQMKFEKEKNQEALGLLIKMDKQVNKLTKLIVDLLDTTKFENGQIKFLIEDFDFNDLVKELADEMQHTTNTHKIVVELCETRIINGDRSRIGQVITNLISNAIKYSPNSNKIIVSTIHEKGKIKFCVQDFGIGIEKEKQSKIFDRFFRVMGNNEHNFPGLGLGLFISSEIVKRHKGKIFVISTIGSGSNFCFTLPINY